MIACISKRRFLEASAGTGKTFAIQHHLIRSIIEASFSERFLDAQNVLVVTFTKASAKELRVRIEETVYSAISFLQEVLKEGKIPQEIKGHIFSYLFEYLAIEDQSLFLKQVWAFIYALKRFQSDIDLATISTIHSFIYTTISSFSQVPNFDMDSNGGDIHKIAHAPWIDVQQVASWVEESLMWALPKEALYPNEWRLLVEKFSRQKSSLADELATRLMAQQFFFQKQENSEFVNFREKWRHTVEHAFEQTFSLCQDRLQEATLEECFCIWLHEKMGAQTREGKLKKNIVKAVQSFFEVFRKKSTLLVWYNTLTEVFSILDPLVEADFRKRKKSTLLTEPIQNCIDEFIATVWEKMRYAVSVEAHFERLYQFLAPQFLQKVRKGDWKTSESLIELASCLIDAKWYLDFLRTRYRVVIIDEFQDTDPLQWGIFRKAFLDDPESSATILLVGDPKQAIYQFRDADVYTYLKAKTEFSLDEVQTLQANYRASLKMVEGINRLFSYNNVDSWLFFMPKIERSLASLPLTSCASTLDFQISREGAPLCFMLFSGEKGRKKKWPTDEIEHDFLFDWIAKEIVSLKKEENISYNECVILVKDRYQALRVEQFLTKKGIASKTVRVDDITDSVLFGFFVSLFRIIETPTSESLLSLFFLFPKNRAGISLVTGLLDDNIVRSQFVDMLFHARDLFYSLGLGAMIHRLSSTSFCFGMTLRELIIFLFGEDRQLFIDFEHMVEITSQLQVLGFKTLLHIVDGFSMLKTLFIDDPDFLIRRMAKSSSDIQIMTMHRSKGLEFSIVFALGASMRPQNVEEEEEEESSFCSPIRMEMEAEKLRLLYVTMTRAKKRLYIPCCIETSGKSQKKGSLAPIELFFAAHRATLQKKVALKREEWIQELYRPLEYREVLDIVAYLQNGFQGSDIIVTSSTLQNEKTEYEEIQPLIEEIEKIDLPLYSQQIKKNIKVQFREYTSFSKIQKNIEKIDAPKKITKDLQRVEKKGTLFGIRFHALVASWVTGDFTLSEDFISFSRECQSIDCSQKIQKQFPLWHEMADELARMFVMLITTVFPFSSENISLLEMIEKAYVISEQSFLELYQKTSRQEKMLQGSIDLVVIYKSKIYLFDWKTNTLSENASLYEVILESGYHIQAELYSAVVQRYISSWNKENSHNLLSFGGFSTIFVERMGTDIDQVGIFFQEDEKGSMIGYQLISDKTSLFLGELVYV